MGVECSVFASCLEVCFLVGDEGGLGYFVAGQGQGMRIGTG